MEVYANTEFYKGLSVNTFGREISLNLTFTVTRVSCECFSCGLSSGDQIAHLSPRM